MNNFLLTFLKEAGPILWEVRSVFYVKLLFLKRNREITLSEVWKLIRLKFRNEYSGFLFLNSNQVFQI